MDLPRDQHGTTERIRRTGVLTVGVSAEGDAPAPLAEREKRLVEEVARRLGVLVQWRRGNVHELLQELEEVKLPMVAAMVPCDTPFSERIGLSRPYLKKGPDDRDYCLAVAPGENRLLLLVDQVVADESRQGAEQ